MNKNIFPHTKRHVCYIDKIKKGKQQKNGVNGVKHPELEDATSALNQHETQKHI